MSLGQELLDAFLAAYDPQIWGIPWAVLGIGAVSGVGIAVWLTRTTDGALLALEGRKLDLERRRDQTIRAVRALDQEKDKLDPEDYERERRALLAQGAETLRSLDEEARTTMDDAALKAAIEARRDALGPDRVAAIYALLEGAAAPPTATRPWLGPKWEGALWTLAGAGVLLALFLTLRGMASLEPAAPPGSATGSVASDPRLAELEAKLAANPEDVALLNQLTDVSIGTQSWEKAQTYNQKALTLQPKDPEARTWEALLTYRAGSYPEAIAKLDSVIQDRPDFGRARQFRGIIDLQIGRYSEALAQFEQALQLATDERTKFGLRQLIAEAQKGLGQNDTPAGTPELTGTITLAAGVDTASWGGNAQVVIAVRDPQGPPMPLRAVKLPAGPFPLGFSISAADAPMRGGPLPAAVTLVVKVDLDGNAMGDDPGAPKVAVEGLSPGATDIQVTLGPP